MHYRAICISRHIRGRTVGVTTAKVAPGVILPSHQYLAFGFFYPSPPRPLLYKPRGIYLCGICLAIPAVAAVLVAVRLAFFGALVRATPSMEPGSARFTPLLFTTRTFVSTSDRSAMGQQQTVCNSLACRLVRLQRIAPDESKGHCGAHELGATAK